MRELSRGVGVNMENRSHQTPLHMACGMDSGDPAVVAFLIAHGANVNKEDKYVNDNDNDNENVKCEMRRIPHTVPSQHWFRIQYPIPALLLHLVAHLCGCPCTRFLFAYACA
jgi:Ankyrin repeat